MLRKLLCKLLILLCILLLAGCGGEDTAAGELWIVTEQTTWDRMNGQAEAVIEAFEESHPGVTVRLDLLPTDEQERSVYLQQLRTQILQGGGPDGYLLPTDNSRILDEPKQYTFLETEPLFVDAELAMRNGLFYDVSALYDADDTLGKEGLNTQIMDAGVVDGKRYILPLRYDIPVLYARHDALEAAGLDPSLLEGEIDTIMEAVLDSGDALLAGGLLREDLDVFSGLLDYETGNAALAEEALARYIDLHNQLTRRTLEEYWDTARFGSDYDPETGIFTAAGQTYQVGKNHAFGGLFYVEKPDLFSYAFDTYYQEGKEYLMEDVEGNLIDYSDEKWRYFPLYLGSLSDCFVYASIAAFEEIELSMVPMRSMGGDVVATVTYYAAVGCGSRQPELTYEFLRQFLLEESQWEDNRPTRSHTGALKSSDGNRSNDQQHPGLIAGGWPVRDRAAAPELWDIVRMQFYQHDVGGRMRKIGLREMDSSEVPLFDITIDQVRFNTTLSDSFAEILTAAPEEQAGLTRELSWNVRYHISEG